MHVCSSTNAAELPIHSVALTLGIYSIFTSELHLLGGQ